MTETSKVARVGRSYPRPVAAQSAPVRRNSRRGKIAGALIAAVSALSVIGWLTRR